MLHVLSDKSRKASASLASSSMSTNQKINRINSLVRVEPVELTEEAKKLIAALLFAHGYKYSLEIVDKDMELPEDAAPHIIYIKMINDNKLICSVKQIFAKEFESVEITAQELGLACLLPKDDLNTPEMFEKILEITSAKGITNTGLLGLTSGKIVEDSDYYWSRSGLYTLLVLALMSEFGFAALQFSTSLEGWTSLIQVEALAYIAAIVGTVLDFIVNISTISPSNDANAGVFAKIVTDSSLMFAMLSIIRMTSLLSYFAGASGNILGVLPYLLTDTSPLTMSLVAILTVAVAVIGTSYYSAFNGTPTISTFAAIEKYLSAKKADNNLFRWIKIIEENLYLYGFRAGSFSAIGASVISNFVELSDEAAFDIAAVIFFASVVNLAATRSMKVVSYWSNNDFAFIRSDEKKVNLSYLPSVIFTRDTFSQAIVTAGYILLGIDSYVTAICYTLAASLLLNSLIAQCDRLANQEVHGKMTSEEIKESKKTYADSLINSQEEPLISNSTEVREQPTDSDKDEKVRQKRMNAAANAYKALAATYPQDTSSRLICTAGSTLTRGIGFIDFASTLSFLIGVELTSLQTIAIACILAPTNMRNMYSMFYSNMVEYGTQKEAEAFVYSCANSAAASSFTLFTKSAVSYERDEIKNALMLKAKELGYTPILATPSTSPGSSSRV